MPDYVVYSTSNTHYQRWQCELLEYSFASAKQPGKLICLCSEGENGDLPMRTSNISEVVALPSYMKNEQTGDFWGIANKMMSLKTWIADETIDGSILFLDPDMLFISPIDLNVEEGQIIGQRWVGPGVADSPLFGDYCRLNRENIVTQTAFMYPYIMHASDVRKTIDRYLELAYEIREKEKKWESDMFALIIIAAEYGLDVQTRDDLGVCNTWEELNQQPSNIVHFPGPFIAADAEKIWFKQDFTRHTLTVPWQSIPNQNAAASRAEYAVLDTLKKFVNQQKLDDRMSDFLYWGSLAESDCLGNYTPDTDKFIVFDQYPGGFNNIRMSLELAAVFAYLMNRTLVLPPRTGFYLLEGDCGFEDFFDMDDLGINTISFEAFCQRMSISTNQALDEIWLQIAAESQSVDWNFTEEVTLAPGEELNSDYARRYLASRKAHQFSQEMLDAEAIFFSKNLLGNYYLNIYAGDRLNELSLYVARHIHYRREMFLDAWNIIDHLGDGAYAAMHVRRNDFQYKDLFISGEEILKNVRPILKPGEVLYIATDADDTSFLAPLEAVYKVCYFKDLKHLINRYMDGNLIGCIEQLVCTRARVFIGNKLSTLSSYAYRLRGYMDDVFDESYYDNTTPCKLTVEQLKMAPTPSWAGQSVASWTREFPEVWAYKNQDIFVSIASYRDPDVCNTIADILATAADPDRLVLGVCLQEEDDKLDAFPYRDHPKVRSILMNYRDAKGVCFARSKIQTDLYRGEKYYLQIDSHSRFKVGWDTYLKATIDHCRVSKPIFSTYPNHFLQNDKEKKYLRLKKSNGILYKEFNDDGYLHVIGGKVIDSELPVHGMWIGAGFIFAHGRWIKEVPYNPDIYFKGEEDSLLIRSYCHGWDVFVPPLNAIYHDYNDNRLQSKTKVRPLHWEDHKDTPTGYDILEKVYQGIGLGSARTIEEFQSYFGVDLRNKEIKEWAKQGFTRSYYEDDASVRAISIELDSDAIEPGQHQLWIFCLYDDEGNEVFRKDFTDEDIIKARKKTIELFFEPKLYEANLTRALIWPFFGPGDFAPRHEYEIDVNMKQGWIKPRNTLPLIVDLSSAQTSAELGKIIIIFIDSKGSELSRTILDDPALLKTPSRYSVERRLDISGASEYVVLSLLKNGSFLAPRQYAIV